MVFNCPWVHAFKLRREIKRKRGKKLRITQKVLNKICGSIQQLGIESLLFQPPEVPTKWGRYSSKLFTHWVGYICLISKSHYKGLSKLSSRQERREDGFLQCVCVILGSLILKDSYAYILFQCWSMDNSCLEHSVKESPEVVCRFDRRGARLEGQWYEQGGWKEKIVFSVYDPRAYRIKFRLTSTA